MQPIEFWFDFSSPYAYFAAETLDDRLSGLGRRILWRPFLLGAAFRITGMSSLTHTPLRGDYARRDWARISKWLGIPFVLPPHHPFRSQNAARAFYWLEEHSAEASVPFAKRVFESHFREGRDITGKEACLDLLPEFSDRLGVWLDTAEARDMLRSRTDEAVSKGVFGSPFFIVDGEPFWGWDRLPFVERLLRQGTA
jgi:2-hydroxychromene-2-carboxylate isomerase